MSKSRCGGTKTLTCLLACQTQELQCLQPKTVGLQKQRRDGSPVAFRPLFASASSFTDWVRVSLLNAVGAGVICSASGSEARQGFSRIVSAETPSTQATVLSLLIDIILNLPLHVS